MKPTLYSTVSITLPPVVERRSFLWKAGAALSATVASAAAVAISRTSESAGDGTDTGNRQVEHLSAQLGVLEDTHAIRLLHHEFGCALNERRYEDIVDLFSDDSEVHFNGGIFVGKNAGVRRLYVQHFGAGFTAGKMEPIHRSFSSSTQNQDVVEIAPDRRSAEARFQCLMLVEVPVISNSSLVEMARQQGQGTLQWWESGAYENSYVKVGDAWKIRQLRYRALSPAQRP